MYELVQKEKYKKNNNNNENNNPYIHVLCKLGENMFFYMEIWYLIEKMVCFIAK